MANTSRSVCAPARARGSIAPICRFSSTVRVGNTWRPSATWPMPRLQISCDSRPPIDFPFWKRTVPHGRFSMPAMVRMSEDLPAPFAPTMATISPLPTSSADAGERLGVAVIQIEIARPGGNPGPHFRHSFAEVALEHRGVAHHLLGRAARDHLAVVQHADVLRERHHRAHHVLDQQDGEALGAVDVAEHLDHLVALGRAQPGHHLVEQQQARPGGERARDLQALAVGQGERGGGEMGLRIEIELSQDGTGMAPRARHRAFPLKRTHDHVVEHRQAGERLDQLEGAADAGGADLVGAQALESRLPSKTISPPNRARRPRRSC